MNGLEILSTIEELYPSQETEKTNNLLNPIISFYAILGEIFNDNSLRTKTSELMDSLKITDKITVLFTITRNLNKNSKFKSQKIRFLTE